ncbi:hypothetical protein DM01DRAFT_205457 [Hesseltinella vesiculosa]|uniref:GAR domain-containing protein n=1 Tax=Hesseltinella vesiculosa TaxID=101127 RepID=A0A1X2GID2_9FUNG|nr:hypothetical protein DM01DRAFT_205457 [Hesseltinella vesiculosa]
MTETLTPMEATSSQGPEPTLNNVQGVEDAILLLSQQHSTMTMTQVSTQFDTIKQQISVWMEQTHLTLFNMEQQVKDGVIVAGIDSLQKHLQRMDKVLADILLLRDQLDARAMEDEPLLLSLKMAITKIQSEWSGVQHFMLSVVKQTSAIHERQELLQDMEDLIWDIDQLTAMIFQYQEKRYVQLNNADSAAASPPTPIDTTPSLDALHSPSLSPSVTATTTTPAVDDNLLVELDQRVDPVFRQVEQVYSRMTSQPPLDESGLLARKHRLVQEHWECLRIEIDDLKDEIKEDRWLVVFRQVANQVDTMIDGLDKTVQQGITTVQQILDWQDALQQQHAQHTNDNPQSPSLSDKLSKSFSRYLPNSLHHPQHTKASHATTVTPMPPLDRDKFKLLEKNMDAKYKYYTPSIDRMLSMLGNGIATRVAKDTTGPGQRHASMIQRWQQLKKSMDDLRMDMVDAQRYLVDVPLSPASSVQSEKGGGINGRWRSLRRRPSDQSSTTSSSAQVADANSKPGRRPSAYRNRHHQQPSSQQQQEEDPRRGVRSVTPSSAGYRSRLPLTSPLTFHQQAPVPQSHRSTTLLQSSTSESSSIDEPYLHHRRTTTPSINGRKSATPLPRRPLWNNTKTNTEVTYEPLWKGESRAAAAAAAIAMDTTTTTNTSSSAANQGRGSSNSAPMATLPKRSVTPSKQVASFMKPTKSTILRHRSPSFESQEQPQINHLPLTTTRKKKKATKTPSSSSLQYHLPPRPKSSMATSSPSSMHSTFGHGGNTLAVTTAHGQLRSASSLGSRARSPPPARRSATPSLIPRPKTPVQQPPLLAPHARPTSPSLIPRPRSRQQSFLFSGSAIPPVPPLPSHLEPPSLRLFKVGKKKSKSDLLEGGRHATSSSSFSVPFDSQLPSPLLLDASASPPPPSSTDSFRRLVKKKQSMPNLTRQHRYQPPVQSFSDDEDDFAGLPSDPPHDHHLFGNHDPSHHLASPPLPGMEIDFQHVPTYTGDPKDPLDMEVAMILNASPISIPCQRSPQGGGKYYFGNDLNPSGAGKKLYTCKLMNYAHRSSRRRLASTSRNKVLVRVGGGWQDLEMFLLEHASLMTSDVIVRSFVAMKYT